MWLKPTPTCRRSSKSKHEPIACQKTRWAWQRRESRLKARWSAAKARRAEAVAGYRRIEAEFARTRVRSPINGVVIARTVNPGETVNLGTPLLRIVDLKRLRIEAEVDAYDIPRLCHRMLRDNHRGGLRGPKLAGHRRGNRRQPDPPPHSPRRPRPTDRHPRSAPFGSLSSSPVR